MDQIAFHRTVGNAQALKEFAMSLQLYSHPCSSACQKVLIALWENEITFDYRHLETPGVAEARSE